MHGHILIGHDTGPKFWQKRQEFGGYQKEQGSQANWAQNTQLRRRLHRVPSSSPRTGRGHTSNFMPPINWSTA